MDLRTASAGLLAVTALTLAPTAASAAPATLWAAPDGAGDLCSPAEPCAVAAALRVAADGDEVVLTPGRYVVESLVVPRAVELHGSATGPRPVVVTTGSGPGVLVNAAATLHDLAVETASSGSAMDLHADGAVLERVRVTNTRLHGYACAVGRSVLVRDSACWAPAGTALGSNLSASRASSVRVRNVTAVGGDAGLSFWAGGGTPTQAWSVDARNVVARGGRDVVASVESGGRVQITLEHSSFESVEVLDHGGSVATVTEPGSGGNQVEPPQWVDAAHGDFRQLPTSPTVDAGGAAPDLGGSDLDGDARSLPATAASCPGVPDIGADELTTGVDCAPAPAPAVASAPETRLLSGPPHRVRTRGHRARVRLEFSGERAVRFECALDRAAYAACGSPLTLRLRPGRHTVTVRAVGASGLVDPTPAATTFRVRRQ